MGILTSMLPEGEVTIRLFKDGYDFCALLGPDLMTGEAGFGDSPSLALRALAAVLDVNETEEHRESE
jgi:hypothetical protein